MLFSDLPTEILQNILSCIDVPQDLLHIALSCKGFYEMVIPDHLDFISISSNIHNSALWMTLKTYPFLPKRISRLYILDFPIYGSLRYLPGKMHKKRDVADEGLSGNEDLYTIFKSVVCLMANISHFEVNGSMPIEVLLDTLPSISRQLRSLRMNLDLIDRPVMKEIPQITLAFPCLNNFSFEPASYSPSCRLCRTLFHHIMFGAPSLVNICIDVGSACRLDCPDFFTRGNWPKLRRLFLHGCFNLYSSATLGDDLKIGVTVAFFERHPLLECLSIYHSRDPTFKEEAFLRQAAFPSLRSFRFAWTCTVSFMNQLYHISNLHKFPPSTFRQLVSLRSCTLDLDAADVEMISALLDAVPQLERLHVASNYKHEACNSPEPSDPCDCNEAKLRTLISRFSNLTHLSLLSPQALELWGITKYDYLIRQLPKLKYLQLTGRLYFIKRDATSSITYQRLDRFPDYINSYDNWGDLNRYFGTWYS